MTKTQFGDLRQAAADVVRVTTAQSLYFVAFHNERGRRYVVVRGQEGSDREHVVVRDSDPRIGDQSMFDLPIEQWVGQVMEIATMRTSVITKTEMEQDAGASLSAKLQVNVNVPPGLDEAPRIALGLGRGTNFANAQPRPVNPVPPSMLLKPQGSEAARQVVVGEAQPPYPLRHVLYAENIAALLRSIHRRDSLLEDLDPDLRARYLRALDDADDLLKLIRRRAKR